MGNAESFDKLASLCALFGMRSQQVQAFRAALEPLQQGKLEVVDGESAILSALESKLNEAFNVLQGTPHLGRDAMLTRLSELLDDVDWELAEELRPDLERKSQHQSSVLDKIDLDVREWESQAIEIDNYLSLARFRGAPFSALEAELISATSAINGVRSARADRLYGGLPSLQVSAQRAIDELQKKLADARPLVDRVSKLVKQADLLIMQVGVANGDYEYRVLLRSADRFQTRGINIIQDVRRLSRVDREWMVELLAKLTGSMNDGIRAAHVANSPPVVAAADPAAPPEATGQLRTIGPAEPTVERAEKDAKKLLGTLGEFMFRMVIPEQMQGYLRREEWSFSITTNDLELPWELISYEQPGDGASELQYLCLERSVSRMPLGGVFPARPPARATVARRKRRMLLIHSDPNNTLASAGTEVESVQSQLGTQLEIERVDPTQATNAYLNELLMGEPFDFLHYAGHALFDRTSPSLSGLLLKDGLLTAEKIRLLNKGGSLVFLNACESGTVARESEPQRVSYLLSNPEPVVGLASAFVYSGALGCVGSLWPVYDRPATDLAVQFYTNVLTGDPTGEALRKARSTIRAKYAREITWAGYVLYGDPTFRLLET